MPGSGSLWFSSANLKDVKVEWVEHEDGILSFKVDRQLTELEIGEVWAEIEEWRDIDEINCEYWCEEGLFGGWGKRPATPEF